MDFILPASSGSPSPSRRPGKPSPVVGIILFIAAVAVISGAGYWMVRGGEFKPGNILPFSEPVASKKPVRKQYFAPFTDAKSSRARQRVTRSSPSLDPTVPGAPSRAGNGSEGEAVRATERASGGSDRIEATALRGNGPTASDSESTTRKEQPIYSANDADVIPPRLDEGQFLSPAPVETDPSEPILVDVVVNELGTADSVKATSMPQTLGKYLWMTNSLSAVKTWHFRPALRDGEPVKYRLILQLEKY